MFRRVMVSFTDLMGMTRLYTGFVRGGGYMCGGANFKCDVIDDDRIWNVVRFL